MVCGICGCKTHKRRTFPHKVAIDGGDAVQKFTRKKRKKKNKKSGKNKIDVSNILYVVFDVETNGFSKNHHDIVDMYATFVDLRDDSTNT